MGGALDSHCGGLSPPGPDDNDDGDGDGDSTTPGTQYRTHFWSRKIGEGQFSKAYRCWRNGSPESRYALKVFIPDPDACEHAENEIRVLRALGSHPRIIELVDVDTADASGAVHVVLELCEGGELYGRIKQKGHYEEPEATMALRQILEAVDFMHGRGVMHRDLKPENVLLISRDSDVDIKVCDFGIAKMAEPPKRLPRSRSFSGSTYYLAPEMIMQEEYGREIDIWAVGVTSYAILSGGLPFVGEKGDLRETYRKIVDRELEFEGEAWADTSEGAMDFVQHLLSARREARPTAAAALCHVWLSQVWAEDSDKSDTSVDTSFDAN